MKTLVLINDPPYGTERVYNALRLARALLILAAKAQQKTPDGYYNVERMLKQVLGSKGSVLLCGTCMDARGIGEADLLEGARRSTMDELASTTVEADKVLIF